MCSCNLLNTLNLLIQDYIALVERTTPSCGHSLQFLLGQSFLYTGEMDKALNCFVGAASGIGTKLMSNYSYVLLCPNYFNVLMSQLF